VRLCLYTHYINQDVLLLLFVPGHRYEFHWGLGSLTHANAAATLQPPKQQVV
jgi:hypothetical protein